MNETHRPYQNEGDVTAICAIVSAGWRDGAQWQYWHTGDLWWHIFRAPTDPTAEFMLWENGRGMVVGFALNEGVGVDVYTHPDADPLLKTRILAWCEIHWRGADGALTTYAAENDPAWLRVLAERGYERTGEVPHLVHLSRTLDELLPDIMQPDGVTVRAVRDDELAARVALHRAVWRGSSVTEESYAAMRQVAGYDADLDLVAVLPDGTLAAYCICWHDAASDTAEFEPVGTHAEYRRRGLARAVLAEGLRRMQQRGVRTARILTGGTNDTALRLYQSAGFAVATREWRYISPVTR